MPYVPSVASLGSDARMVGAKNLEEAFRFILANEATLTPDYLLMATGEPHAMGNFAILTHANNPDAAREAAEALSQVPAPSLIGFHEEPSAEVEAEIQAHAFTSSHTMPVMAADIDQMPDPPLPEGCRFALLQPTHADAWARCVATAFKFPEGVARLVSPGRSMAPDGKNEAVFTAVFRGDEVVGVTGLFLNGEVAGIYSVGTVPDERGRGIGAHVTAAACRIAAEKGYRVAVLQASKAGYGVYRRLGFQDLGTVPLYFREP